MNRNCKFIPILILLLGSVCTAQLKVANVFAQQFPDAAAAAPRPFDPFGRETPRGAVLGFLKAVHADDYATATQYLQLPPNRRKDASLELARQLGVLMDLKYQGRSVSLSDLPEGTATDALPLDRERIGRIPSEDGPVDVLLVRTDSASNTPVWLFSRETVERVPELYTQVEVPAVARLMPEPLASHKFLALSLGQWIGWLISIPAAVALGWLLLTLLRLPVWLYRRVKHRSDDRIWKERYSRPVLVLVSIIANGFLTFFLGIPLPHRGYYFRALSVLFLAGMGWLAVRMIETAFERVRYRALAGGYVHTGSYLLLTQRIVRILVVILFALLIFGRLGFETKAALAGLGIGGLAIALAAQKTLENLLGGVSLLVDNVVRVGDTCRIGEQVGTVTDIGLRSITVRTVDQTVLSIPNGMLAQSQFENLTGRTKFLIKTNLGLQYETTMSQLQQVLDATRRNVLTHPKLERESARVRFVGFGTTSLNLELFAYVLTHDYGEFLAVQEEVLFQVMQIVGAAGTAFANPVQRVAVEQGSVSIAKTRGAGSSTGA